MDKNADIAKPATDFSWAAEHKAWLTNLYREGIIKTRKEITTKAQEILALPDVDVDVKAGMNDIVNNGKLDDYCKDTFVWKKDGE